jgi:hypothetical protein
MNQSMSAEERFCPIGRGLLSPYPLIKVYQSLPNGMDEDGTRSFLFEADAIGDAENHGE